MLIIKWSWALFALFNWQYSYDVSHQPIDKAHINVTGNGTLITCIYPSDKAFKKGSPTDPRSELRSVYEGNGSFPYKFDVEILSVPAGTDYSVWQVFGDGSPLLMMRHRQGQKEMVVFNGQPKIQVLPEFEPSCTVDCAKGIVACGNYLSRGLSKCSKLYFKVGVYQQHGSVVEKRCVEYGRIKYLSL